MNQPTRSEKGEPMDKNLRDRVEEILRKYCSSSCCFGHEEEATALYSLIAEREIEARIDELKMFDFQYSKGSTYWTVIKGRLEELEQLQSQLKDQKGE